MTSGNYENTNWKNLLFLTLCLSLYVGAMLLTYNLLEWIAVFAILITVILVLASLQLFPVYFRVMSWAVVLVLFVLVSAASQDISDVSYIQFMYMYVGIVIFNYILIQAVVSRSFVSFCIALSLLLVTVFGTTSFMPKGSLVQTPDGQVRYLDEMTLTKPGYTELQPVTVSLPQEGIISFTEGTHWLVEGTYKRTRSLEFIDSEGLTRFVALQKEGVSIPYELLSLEHNPKVAIEQWLSDTYPYLSFENLAVTYTAKIKWF